MLSHPHSSFKLRFQGQLPCYNIYTRQLTWAPFVTLNCRVHLNLLMPW
uniref:Uncharacterized protein n=1 Tax=Arundo donax TaxID=35708 RepID=A0A0A9F2T2_ARUDO